MSVRILYRCPGLCETIRIPRLGTRALEERERAMPLPPSTVHNLLYDHKSHSSAGHICILWFVSREIYHSASTPSLSRTSGAVLVFPLLKGDIMSILLLCFYRRAFPLVSGWMPLLRPPPFNTNVKIHSIHCCWR